MNTFSSNAFKKLRTEAGLTQEELGKIIGISRDTVIAIEKGHPATIDALKLKVIKAWWITCKKRSSEPSQHTFKSAIINFLKF